MQQQQELSDNHVVNSSPATSARVVVKPPKVIRARPIATVCDNCQQVVTTIVVRDNGACVYISAVTLCLVFFPCAWIPFVADFCKDVHHICPSCRDVLGGHKII